jgi:hypothetical protein
MKTHPIRVEVVVEQVVVTGEISVLEPNNIVVDITHPYDGVSGGLHIPYFSMACRENWYTTGDGPSRQGQETAERLLRDVFLHCRYFEANREAIRHHYRLFRQGVLALESAGMTSPERFESERRSMRQKLHARGLGLPEYEKTLAALRKQVKVYQAEKFRLWELFRESIGREVPCGTLEKLIERFIAAEREP